MIGNICVVYLYLFIASIHRTAPIRYYIVKIRHPHDICILKTLYCILKNLYSHKGIKDAIWFIKTCLRRDRVSKVIDATENGRSRSFPTFFVLIVVVGNARSATKAVHHQDTPLNDSFVGFKTFSSGRVVSASPELPPHRLFYSRCDLVGFVFAVIRNVALFSLSLHSSFSIGIPPGKIYPQILALRKTHPENSLGRYPGPKFEIENREGEREKERGRGKQRKSRTSSLPFADSRVISLIFHFPLNLL